MTDKQAEVPLARLETETAAMLASGADTRLFEVDGHTFVFKPDRPKTYAAARAGLAALGCRLAFGEWVAPSMLRTGGIRQEAARLRELARAGRRVPAVLLQNDACLVLSYAGQSFDEIVEHLSEPELIALFERVADDLADWHRNGCWHGGAQLRNVTDHPDGLHRIDFEERHGYVLSVAATRAYDIFLCFGDMLSHLEPEQVLPQGGALLRRYLEQMGGWAPAQAGGPAQEHTGAPALLAMLRRLRRLLRPMVWADARWPRLTRKRDTQRIVSFAKVLQEVLPRSAA